MRDVQLTRIADLSDALAGAQPLSISIGPSGEAVMLVAGDVAAPAIAGYDEQPSWAARRIPRSRAEQLVSATMLIHDGHSAHFVALHDLALAHPYLQPLPGGEILLVGARCRRFADGTAERNAHVYGAGGELKREVTFGDGIADVQTTSGGDIWVSYFDEGVFGNYGWGYGEGSTPIGAMGLVRIDEQGTKLWEYTPPVGVGPIDDCYALNVGEDATWAYYYHDFPLVRIGSDGYVRAWRTEVAGARAFAVDGERALIYGGYRSQRGRCALGRLGDGVVADIVECRLVLPSGELIDTACVIGRGSTLHVFAGAGWYGVDIRTLP